MNQEQVTINGLKINVYRMNTVVVGSGAAGLNAADTLSTLGQQDIAIITEGMNMGTSRNTGSDKQTYYKLTLGGQIPDSTMEMAETLFNGGSMHGDIALVEAASSARAFFKLVNIGVPFPHNTYGEYIGYKTDHDPRQRATSIGPLTSKVITERLEDQVRQKKITIFNGYRIIAVLTDRQRFSDESEASSIGLLALQLHEGDKENIGFALFNCTNIIYAAGGPAGIYEASVYPESQWGATGVALAAGVKAINLTESQFGIASTKFRWNVSGTYQQVLPRYISQNLDGSDEKEFLNDYFPDPGKMLDAVFLKGYQWPFDPRRVMEYGSSLIDLLVYNEIYMKGRKVFLDFRKNPSWAEMKGEPVFSLLGREAYSYLEKSDALLPTPIERLHRMNPLAVELYKSHNIDLSMEPLEISVCAQHSNGGLAGNVWYESSVKHFFPVGEINGAFGVYRPGGAALNSTQVGSMRAAQYIYSNYKADPPENSKFIHMIYKNVSEIISSALHMLSGRGEPLDLPAVRQRMQKRMTKYGAHIRSLEGCSKAMEECLKDYRLFNERMSIRRSGDLAEMYKIIDGLIAQFAYLSTIKEYIHIGGKSRGSYLIQDCRGNLATAGLSDVFRFSLDEGGLNNMVCEVRLIMDKQDMNCIFDWKPVKPIPQEENWFEKLWKDFREGNIIH